LTGKGSTKKFIEKATYTVTAKAMFGITVFQHSGDGCKADSIALPGGTGTIKMAGFRCPINAGDVELDLDVQLSSSIPASLAKLTIDLQASTDTGAKALCAEIKTTAASNHNDYGCKLPDSTDNINDPTFADCHNSMNGIGWVAGRNAFFEGLTFNDAKVLLGTKLVEENQDMQLPVSLNTTVLPNDFDSRIRWPGLIHPIRNQKHCGRCWAFSASEVMSDRVAIARGRASPVLSAEDLVACDQKDNGCHGGQLKTAWEYIQSPGLLTDSCFPYTSGAGDVPMCAEKCVDGSSFLRTRASSAAPIYGVEAMQQEIMTNGPIQVGFKVYKSLMTYKSGVYSKHATELLPEGGHAVKIVGWGVESDTDYWLVANSWDTTWGDEGFFKIKRGSNECGIETMGPPYAGSVAGKNAVIV